MSYNPKYDQQKEVMRRILLLVVEIALFVAFIMLFPIIAHAYPAPIVQSDEFPMVYCSENGDTFIEITKERYYNTNCYVARIVTSDPHLIRTCFAEDDMWSLGKMTEVARAHDAIFMVNADWCTQACGGNFVIRNGEIVRQTYPGQASGAYFCVMDDGHLQFVSLRTSAQEAIDAGVVHSFSFFGVNLFNSDGTPRYCETSIHPRTFMGEVPREDDLLEYIIVVADGRREYSYGLNHYQEANILYSKGCNIGYNLDGGGSTEMVFDGKIINEPSDGRERRDHDFIYVKFGK